MIVTRYVDDEVPHTAPARMEEPVVSAIVVIDNPNDGIVMAAALLILLLSLALVPQAAAETLYTRLWGGFATSLAERSAEQCSNARRAALDLDGVIIPSGGILSFNDRVGGRDAMKGYRPAPTINDRGNLSDVPGGGVCQLATTIYNAALDAGMEIVERHPHSRAVGYVPPGRDATILTWRKDLKLRNPHPFPLMLKVGLQEMRMTAAFWSTSSKPFNVKIITDIIPVEPDAVISAAGKGPDTIVQSGARGFSVITRREIIRNGKSVEQILSRDFYPPPSRILSGAVP
jgi:vancomycin resistance protein VanW